MASAERKAITCWVWGQSPQCGPEAEPSPQSRHKAPGQWATPKAESISSFRSANEVQNCPFSPPDAMLVQY